MQQSMKTFITFMNVSTNKYRERVIRIIENATDDITARHKFISRLLFVSSKGIPVIYIMDDGFEINIVPHHDILKNNQVEQFMLNTDFITQATIAKYIEVQNNYNKDIMKQFNKIPYANEIDSIPSQINVNKHVIRTTTPIPSHNLPPLYNETKCIAYEKNNILDKLIKSIEPINNSNINIDYNVKKFLPQPNIRFYSKSASPTSPLNINAKEFIPIHYK